LVHSNSEQLGLQQKKISITCFICCGLSLVSCPKFSLANSHRAKHELMRRSCAEDERSQPEQEQSEQTYCRCRAVKLLSSNPATAGQPLRGFDLALNIYIFDTTPTRQERSFKHNSNCAAACEAQALLWQFLLQVAQSLVERQKVVMIPSLKRSHQTWIKNCLEQLSGVFRSLSPSQVSNLSPWLYE
jgi:hypothetical protein